MRESREGFGKGPRTSAIRVGTRSSITADADNHELLIPPKERIEVALPPLKQLRGEVFDQHVCLLDESLEDAHPRRMIEIEGDGALVPRNECPGRRPAISRGPDPPEWITISRLDLHDIRPEIGEGRRDLRRSK